MSLIPKLTSAGQGLLVEAITGGTLNFTKIAIGSGDEPKSESTLTALVNTKLELTINSYEKGDDSITLYASFDNKELETGFNWTETGIFAKGDSGSETLYAYCNVGSEYEYVPSSDSGRLVTRTIIITVAVDDAENISVDLSGGDVFALKTDLDDHIKDTNNPHGVTLSQLNAGAAAEKGVDTEITETSVNLPTSAAVYAALKTISDAINNIDLSGYVPTSRTVAGIDLKDNITVVELLSALGLGEVVLFTCTETFSYTCSYPDATITCEGQRYEPDKQITYDELVAILESAGGATTASGFTFTSVTEAKVDNETDNYYSDAGYNTVYACVYNGYVTALVVTVGSDIAYIGDDPTDYSSTNIGKYLADTGDEFTVGGWLIDDEVTEDSTTPVSSGAVYTALQGLATANIVIAASDTDDTLKKRANHICTGDADQSTIVSAANSLENGGKVVLLPGTYVFTATPSHITTSNLWLCGCGLSTIIKSDTQRYFSFGGDNIKVSDMALDGVSLSNVTTAVSATENLTFENLTITYKSLYAILIYGSASSGSVNDNYVRISNVTTICSDTETAGCALYITTRNTLCIGCIGYDVDGTHSQADYVGDNVTFIGCIGFDSVTSDSE